MKTLKLLSMIIAVLIGFSCNKDDSDSYETVRITLLPTIGITQDVYSPLRSASVNDTIYAVQIYEEGTPYYYGLFNDISKMEISLTTNKKYTFKVSSFLKGSGSGLKTIEQNGLKTYFLPDSVTLLNKFIKGDKLTGISSVSNIKLAVNKYSQYPDIDLFYQETEVTVTKGMSSLQIPLKRTGFGIGLSVDGLTSGSMDVYFAGDTIHLTPSTTSYFSIRSFIGGTKGLIDVASVDTYFVETPISVRWVGSNGSIVTASRTIKLKRNYQLPVQINFNSSSQTLSFEKWYSNPPISGLVAWYPFNGNANDVSENGNNGTVYGATLTTDRFGDTNKAYSFNGTSDYIKVLNSTSLRLNQDLTLSAWFCTNTKLANEMAILGKGTTINNTGYLLLITSSFYPDFARFRVSPTIINASLESNTVVNDGKWHHIVGTYDKSLIKLYVDGKFVKSASYSFDISSLTTDLMIGREFDRTARQFNGQIDDVGIWNRALTDDEIFNLYNYR